MPATCTTIQLCKKAILFVILVLFSLFTKAQLYKHISVENGLSGRRIFSIQKGPMGYMWFLTKEGIDRYNGKEFKNYKLTYEGKDINSQIDISWIYVDKDDVLRLIGKRGMSFRFNNQLDQFEVSYEHPSGCGNDLPPIIWESFIDKDNYIWLCGEKFIHRCNFSVESASTISNKLGIIYSMAQYDDTHYFIGTESQVFFVELIDNKLEVVYSKALKELHVQVNELYYDSITSRLYIGTFQQGLFTYDIKTDKCKKIKANIDGVPVTRIRQLNNKEILVATDGAGVYKVNTSTQEAVPYIVADYYHENMMTGNNITDMYIDDDGRIWLANFPLGITVFDKRYPSYNWTRHYNGNSQSLINNCVNSIIEDSDGDIWYATNNGISILNTSSGKWKHILSSFDQMGSDNNHAFSCLCEIAPGIIYASGQNAKVFKINKRSMAVNILSVNDYRKLYKEEPNKKVVQERNIQSIYKDSNGEIWIGGQYYITRINHEHKTVQRYTKTSQTTVILEKDKDKNILWVGTQHGLYLFNKSTEKSTLVDIPDNPYVYSLYQTSDNRLYIGTCGNGLYMYDIKQDSLTHYDTTNSALLSNNICAILSTDKHIILSTENGISRFTPNENDFQNWTKEQGLISHYFNPGSYLLTKNNHILFGGNDGVVEFDKGIKIPTPRQSKIILSDFKLFYDPVLPGEKNSPLTKDINETDVLYLKYNQNFFSLKVSSVNFDSPANSIYSWRLDGFLDKWSTPGDGNIIRFTNVTPGKYTLRIRSISSEDNHVFEERNIEVSIAPPFWRSVWAIMFFILLFVIISIIIIRIIYLRKEQKAANEKVKLFINTAHDIRTPLTLIKAPLEDIQEKETLSESGCKNMNIALRNVNVLLRLTNNLINFERMNLYSSELYIGEYELNAFMAEIMGSFHSYARVKKIDLVYNSNFNYLNVWLDKEKMDSVFKNIISNALKYTPEGGRIAVLATETEHGWGVEVTDSGIGIPFNEQKNLFKTHFRGSNAINLKISGSGLGMVLVKKQVEYHKGKINISSIEGKGTTVGVFFHKGYNHFKHAHLDITAKDAVNKGQTGEENGFSPAVQTSSNSGLSYSGRILIVEDNDELRDYLSDTLSYTYHIITCENGEEALNIINESNPDLIISDVMMPEMRGDELCGILKDNIETSHIPVILLTALNDEQHIIKGLRTGADEYITKPFNVNILKVTIENILKNRSILRKKYANLQLNETKKEIACSNCTSDIDWKFISSIKTHVEEKMDDPHFTIDTLAAKMNMSRTSLYNKIKVLTELSPIDYVRNIRLNKAAELLKAGNMSVTEVAERTGFSDAKYFREVFKKYYNVSPSKYK